MNRSTPTSTLRRRRLTHRAVPLAILSAVAFLAGVLVAGSAGPHDAAARFAAAWERGDYAAMHAELSPAAQADVGVEELQRAYEKAAQIATSTGIDAGEPSGSREADGVELVTVPVSVRTTAFGDVGGEVAIPISDDEVEWQPNLVFPELTEGERLDRRMKVPERAPILARDRSPLAEGPAASRTTNGTGGIITGEIGDPPKPRAKEMAAAGFPEGTPSGTSGIELAFDERLAGTPGGKLLAIGDGGKRVLAERDPQPGEPVRTTIDPKLQDATAAALGDAFGGAAVLNAKNGEVLALAGLAFSAPQPPGSTFKVITVAGALEEGVTKLDEEFPVQTEAVIGGRPISNAYNESCGGTLLESFAHSCNSVFAPLGVRLGGKQLTETAEAFGFNSPPSLYNPDALALTQPPASEIPEDFGSDLDVGVSAIGQGQVLATPLELASVAQTIANDGVRSPTSLVRGPELAGDYPDVKVVSPEVADQVTEMMVAVVESGTGASAALPDAKVAGKTGTAELGTSDDEGELDVNAWFTAFAPAEKPKLAVAVMVVNAPGDGGTVAGPIAGSILAAGL